MSMLDGNTAALREYERRQDEADRIWDACEPQAREELMDKLFDATPNLRGPNIDITLELLFDDIVAALGGNYQAFRRALAARDEAELGRLIHQAAERVADGYIASRAGQDWIAHRVFQIDQDRRSERYE